MCPLVSERTSKDLTLLPALSLYGRRSEVGSGAGGAGGGG